MTSIESKPTVPSSEQEQLSIDPDDLLYVSGVGRLIRQEGLTKEILVTHLEEREGRLKDLFPRGMREPQRKEVDICGYAVGVLTGDKFTPKDFASLIKSAQEVLRTSEKEVQKKSFLGRLLGR